MKNFTAYALRPLMAAAALLTLSCTKDDSCQYDQRYTPPEGYYFYDGVRFDVAWAGYHYDEAGGGYCFGISPTVPAGRLADEPDFFEVDYPESMLGERCNLSASTGTEWYLYGYMQAGGTRYYFQDSYTPGTSHLTDSGNWVRVTHLTGDEFTLEFGMYLNGKLLRGHYCGEFERCAQYGRLGI